MKNKDFSRQTQMNVINAVKPILQDVKGILQSTGSQLSWCYDLVVTNNYTIISLLLHD